MEKVVNIKVVGVGGAGYSIVNRMIASGIDGVSYVTIDTCTKTERISETHESLQIGENLTGGLGTGAKPEIGEKAAHDACGKIEALLKGSDMVFVTAGLGGGCGTGAAPVVAQIAKSLGILTVAVVTTPFAFEGRAHGRVAEEGITALRKYVDSIIVVPNNNLKHVTDSKVTFMNAFAIADSVLVQTVGSIIDLVQSTAEINVDFADVTTVMQDSGTMHVGLARVSGAERAQAVFESIRQSKLLDTTIGGAQRVLLCITASSRVELDEVEILSEAVREAVHPDANIIIGMRLDEMMGDDLQALIVATAIDGEKHPT